MKKSSSGNLFENQVKALLDSQGWEVFPQYELGYRLGKMSKYRVDLCAGLGKDMILVSCKYQDSTGTAIDKIPYEYLSLCHALQTNNLQRAFIVVFGKELEGHHFLNEGMREMGEYMMVTPKVKIVTFTEFQSLVLSGEITSDKKNQQELEI